MDPRWFILADDLTGAADSAIAFARRGLPAKVVWGEARPEEHADSIALAYDAATRELDAAEAAHRHGDALRRFLRPGMHVFKKMDSTLRGNPAEEIAAMLDVLHAQRSPVRVVIAPAFPAMGRTVRDGQIFVHGVPLPFTEFWPASREHDLAVLINLLDTVGVHARHFSLSTVRGDRAALGPGFANGVAVCDAETDDDLERIASAILEGGAATFCIGSAGFAHALAQIVSRASGRGRSSHRCAVVTRGALIVVGSRTQASRAALAQLLTLGDVEGVSVNPALLMGDLQSSAAAGLANGVGKTLARGIDVVVDISQSASAQDAGNPQLAAALARLLAAPARHASALVATGGETAAALLTRLGVEGLRLVDEIEPGIPLGLTLGEISVPAVTKAGGFGNEECLKRILSRLRFIRQTGAVA
jgi:D-threonate/D-erythronate kinase